MVMLNLLGRWSIGMVRLPTASIPTSVAAHAGIVWEHFRESWELSINHLWYTRINQRTQYIVAIVRQ
jgi:hypothetical protein